MWSVIVTDPLVVLSIALGFICLILIAWSTAIVRNEKVARRNVVETEKSFLKEAQARAQASRKVKDPGKLSQLLIAAGIKTDPIKWFGEFFLGGIVLVGVLSVLGVPGIMVVALFIIVIALSIGLPLTKAKKNKRIFAEQLAQALPQIAENVRCGLSPESAVRSVSAHMDDPLREEFRQLNSEIAYGSTLAEAFESMAARTGSDDIKLVATVVAVQTARGGKLSDTFDMVAETVSARLDLRRHVRIITSESRTSMWIVTVLPWLFLIFMGLSDNRVFQFYGTPLGSIVLAVAIGLELMGIFVMTRIGKIKTA